MKKFASFLVLCIGARFTVWSSSFAMQNTVTPLDSARNDVVLSFGGQDEWKEASALFHDFDGPWHEIKDDPKERSLEILTGIRLDGVLSFDLAEWDGFVKRHDSIPLSFSSRDDATGKRYLFSSGTTTDAKDRYVYKVDAVRKWRDCNGPFVCLRPAREWKGLRAEYVFVEKCLMTTSLAQDEMRAMCDDLVARCPTLKIEKISEWKMRVVGKRFRAALQVFSYGGFNGVDVSFYNHVPRREITAWDFSSQTPYLGMVEMEAPCTCMCARRNKKRWNARCRAWIKNASLDEQEANRSRESRERNTGMDNFAYLKRELPVPAFEWGDPDGDEQKTERRYQEIAEKRRMEEDQRWREERRRKDEEERTERKIKDQQQRERAQLAMVESNKVAFAKGEAEAALKVSHYYTAYALKLLKFGKGVEASRAATTSFEWTRKAADAGSARAQGILGEWLLEGGNGRHMYGGCWSGFLPKVPKDGPYVSPIAIQGMALPPDILLSETNGVKTYFRVYGRNPELGMRYIELAAKGGDGRAKLWMSERTSRHLPLWMPEWWLEKDGYRLEGETVSDEEVVTRTGPGFGGTIKRKLERDAAGRVIAVSNEFFADPKVADWEKKKSPWHETNATCVVQEALP